MATFEDAGTAVPAASPPSPGRTAPAPVKTAGPLLSVPGPPLSEEELNRVLAERWADYLRDPSTARDGREVIAEMRAANAAERARRNGR